MPCFNHERFVVQALQSVADSSHAAIEMICIDDASVDRSFALAEAWLRANERRFVKTVCLRHDANRGISATLNELVAHAQGEYITFIASDDLLTASGIARQVERARATGAGFVFSDSRLIDEAGATVADSAIRYFGRDVRRLQRRSCLMIDVLLNWEAPWTRIFATAALIRELGLFDETLHFEDRDFIVRVLSHGSFTLLPEPVYCYRIRLGARLTPGLDATRMRLDYLRAEAKNLRSSRGLVRAVLAVNVLAGRVRFDRRGRPRPSWIWPVFAALRRALARAHLLAMR
jgi:glycosyltransferase involved in cell wall biosynthesis